MGNRFDPLRDEEGADWLGFRASLKSGLLEEEEGKEVAEVFEVCPSVASTEKKKRKRFIIHAISFPFYSESIFYFRCFFYCEIERKMPRKLHDAEKLKENNRLTLKISSFFSFLFSADAFCPLPMSCNIRLQLDYVEAGKMLFLLQCTCCCCHHRYLLLPYIAAVVAIIAAVVAAGRGLFCIIIISRIET